MRRSCWQVGLLFSTLVGSSPANANAVEDVCARQAVGVQAEMRAASDAEWTDAVLQLVREAARRGCLAARSSAPPDISVAAEAAPIGSVGKTSEGDFMDDLLWDLTHDTKGKYKRSRQFK